MARKVYNWNRYWVPRDGAFAFDQEGFLLAPYTDPQWRKLQRTDAVEFSAIQCTSCLVLLGEPGIGKTFALDALERSLRDGPSPKSLFRNLGSYGNDQRLIDDLFGSAEFRVWANSGGELCVFLDSFDECLLRLDNLASLLADQFQRLRNVDGLFFRITSRTAEWRVALEQAMRHIWGEDRVGVYELAPLTRDQVRVALEAEDIDPQAFIQEVIDREVVSFAIKPLTLDLLMRIWKNRGGSLPPTQLEIYEQGCLELCSEPNPGRDTPRLRRLRTAEQRLAIAGHIAAATTFCKRSAISIASRPILAVESDVTISELSQGEVRAQETTLPVNVQNLRETFDTGLFTARGPDRLGWAHQTYAEFLSSRYLEQQNVSSEQIFDLIQHPTDPEKKLVPQLHETAAWIASTNAEVFQQILTSEPDLLLRSDVATADDEIKKQLVDAVLLATSRADFRTDWWKLRSRYRKLNYPGLAKQLSRKLQDRRLPNNAKIEVVEIIEACNARDLFPTLVRIAVNTRENIEFRQAAADVIARAGDITLKRQLKPLALGLRGADQNEELRGAGLRSCWPGTLTVRELFGNLEMPSDHVTSRYSLFISNNLVDGIADKELPIALKWAEAQPQIYHFNRFGETIHKIMQRGASALNDPKVRRPFVAALLSRLRCYDYSTGTKAQPLNTLLDANSDLRRRCIEIALGLFREPSDDALLVTTRGVRLVQPDDLPWLLTRLLREKSSAERQKLSHLIRRIFYPDKVDCIEMVIEAAKRCLELQTILGLWLNPIGLDSEEGKKLKGDWDQEQEWQRMASEQTLQPPPLDPPPTQRIRGLLDLVDRGEFDAWWQISFWSEVEDNGQYSRKDHYIDIRKLPGWEKATEPDKKRMVVAAENYLRQHKADAGVWFANPKVLYRPMLAGLRALLLVSNEDRKRFDLLPNDVWTRWIPAIVHRQHCEETEEFRFLLATAIEKVPKAATKEILVAVEQENRKDDTLWVLYKLGEKFDTAVGSELLARLGKTPGLKTKCAAQLLTACVVARIPGGLEQARRWIPNKSPRQKRRRALASEAAHLLLLNTDASHWRQLWDLIQEDSGFGKGLFERLAYEHHHVVPPLIVELPPHEVGLLWEWMLKQYPVSEDPDRSRGGSVTSRWAMADLRDALVSSLADRGNVEANEEITRLKAKFPQFEWFSRLFARAKEQTRRNTWKPVSPAELFQLVSRREGRLIQNADQLMDAVCDAVGKVQAKLHGETPAAPFLWNGDRPKEEEAISDWAKIELDALLVRRGVILNREVQIHIKERTDIHIDAITQDPLTSELDRAKVIVEVKGCWNPDQKTAIKKQLLSQYLAQNDCSHGIFLYGWFLCDSWSLGDSRRNKVPFKNRADAEAYFAAEATRLSTTTLKLRSIILDATLTNVRRTGGRKRNRS